MNEEEKEFAKAFAEGAIEGIGKQIPIYNDLLQPGVQEIGQGLKNAVKLALIPLTSTIWALDKMGEWINFELEKRLKDIPLEDIVTPKTSVIGPAIESLKFLKDEEELKEMFAQLIANSMNKETKEKIHPGFVETLRSLSSADARFIKMIFLDPSIEQLYSVQFTEMNYVNLERLGIFKFVSPGIGTFSKYIHFSKNLDRIIIYGFTEYGKLFCEACLE